MGMNLPSCGKLTQSSRRFRLDFHRNGIFSLMKKAYGVSIGVCVAVSALLFGSLSISVAAPRKDLQQVAQQVRELQMEAGAAAELVHRAQVRLKEIQSDLNSISKRADRERAEMRVAMSRINDIARAAYTSGGIDSTLQLLLAEDPDEFLAQAATMGQLEQTQLAQLGQARTARLRIAQTEAEITEREARAQQVRGEMGSAQKEVDAQLSASEDVLSGLQAEERQRLSKIAGDRRQTQIGAAAEELSRLNSGSAGSSGSKRARLAVQYALAQVGEPYSFSARPPDSWDCSKLTTAAWGKSGVGLTPLSFTQWDQTRRVPVSKIRPGDLVFYFGRGAHHVAIYIGGGKMVSASNPSDGVEIIDFLGPWYKERFSGVGRVI